MAFDATRIDDTPLDVEEFASKGTAKVTLDIDDAPFLVDDEPEPVVEKVVAVVDTSAEDAAHAAALRRRKRIVLTGIATAFILIATVATWYFVLREIPAEEEAAPSATVIVVPSPENIPGPMELPVGLEPFLIPQNDHEGKVRLLRLQVTSMSTDENITREVKDKTLVLRDAVYYYLRNKSHEYMLDPASLPVIKQDILDIVNGYLTQGKLEDLFIENYLMR